MYDAFLAEWKEYMQVHQQIIALSKQNHTEEAISVLLGPSLDVYNRVCQLLVELVRMNTEGGNKASLEGDEGYALAKKMVSGLLVAGMLIGALLALFIIRAVLRQLGKDPGALNAIAPCGAGRLRH